MKTPFKNTEFSFLLKRKLLISFLLFPSEKKRNSRLKLVKRGNFLKMRNSGKNLKFYVLKKFSKNYLNFFVL